MCSCRSNAILHVNFWTSFACTNLLRKVGMSGIASPVNERFPPSASSKVQLPQNMSRRNMSHFSVSIEDGRTFLPQVSFCQLPNKLSTRLVTRERDWQHCHITTSHPQTQLGAMPRTSGPGESRESLSAEIWGVGLGSGGLWISGAKGKGADRCRQ